MRSDDSGDYFFGHFVPTDGRSYPWSCPVSDPVIPSVTRDVDKDCSSGMILICGMGILATYTGYVIGQFKLAHPGIQNMGDAGFILFGRVGREFIGFAQVIVLVFIMSAHITSFSIMMNVLTNHATCSIVFGVVGLTVSLVLALPRTQRVLSYVSVVCKSSRHCPRICQLTCNPSLYLRDNSGHSHHGRLEHHETRSRQHTCNQ